MRTAGPAPTPTLAATAAPQSLPCQQPQVSGPSPRHPADPMRVVLLRSGFSCRPLGTRRACRRGPPGPRTLALLQPQAGRQRWSRRPWQLAVHALATQPLARHGSWRSSWAGWQVGRHGAAHAGSKPSRSVPGPRDRLVWKSEPVGPLSLCIGGNVCQLACVRLPCCRPIPPATGAAGTPCPVAASVCTRPGARRCPAHPACQPAGSHAGGAGT